jgi:hypothetical protein
MDETCKSCYALAGWYRTDIKLQVDRVLRLEYLQRLVREDRLDTWVEWMVQQLNGLQPDESFPSPPPAAFDHGWRVRYLRWHDSGDLFHHQYARAIFRVCEATPRVAHWLPTRMGALLKSIVRQGVGIPPNLSILVSVRPGGRLEAIQKQAVSDILRAQPSASVGVSYFVNGPARRKVNLGQIEESFGRGAVICQAITALDPKERVCGGCRRCWAASLDAPIIYPKS